MVLVFGGLHLVALALGCLLFWMFLRSETVAPWEPEEGEEGGGGGGGGNDRIGPPKPLKPGGLPLDSADQSDTRLRGPGRLADAHPFPRTRRPEHAPLPERTPERV
ncbi:MAG: hypothetical protein QOF76_602 [Solirubrobacteraceae bacterium]|nr:hypothetical protein [Solirubrobacteraceae bacterium]